MPKKCPNCGGKTIMVEYGLMDKYHYDGVSEWACVKGDWRVGRFCEQVLEKDAVEPPHCQGNGHPRVIAL